MSNLNVHLRDLELSYVSAGVVGTGPGVCLSDSHTEFIEFPLGIDVDITVGGVNGLDAGAEAPSTWYYVWLIKNLVTGVVAGLLSLSSTAPTMPVGFTTKRRIGVIRNDGAGNFLNFKQFSYGNRRRYEWWYDMTGRRVLAAGGNANWTVVGCASIVPPTADVMWLNVLQTVAGVAANVRSMGNTLDTGGQGRAFNSVNVSLFTDTQQFQYKNSIAGGFTYIEVCAFEEMV